MAVGTCHQVEGLDIEVELRTHTAQQCHIAAAAVAEVEILAHHDLAGTEAPHEHTFDERLGTLSRLLRIEAHQHGGIDAGGGEQFELLVEIGEQFRGRLGPHHRGRVSIEGDDDRVGAERCGPFAHRGDDRLMTAMHTVVGADGDHRSMCTRATFDDRPQRTGEIGHHVHGRRRYRRCRNES
jgi:hypothetical protein